MMNSIEGIYTAFVTPFKGQNVDLNALNRLADRQIEAGVHGLVVCATTGEGSLLTPDERRTVISAATKRVRGDAKIIVGTGSISTQEVIESTRIAADLGAEAALVFAPPYTKPSQEGIAAHFEAVADQSKIPIILYNVPSRTVSDILPSTVARLAKHERIVGIKEASGSIQRIQQVIAASEGHISVLSGDDPLTLSLLVAGGQGVICTCSNVVPNVWVEMWNAWKRGDLNSARDIQGRLLGMHEALFAEANPSPVPLLKPLVVKKGSKIRSEVSLFMPIPVSLTVAMAYVPGFTL